MPYLDGSGSYTHDKSIYDRYRETAFPDDMPEKEKDKQIRHSQDQHLEDDTLNAFGGYKYYDKDNVESIDGKNGRVVFNRDAVKRNMPDPIKGDGEYIYELSKGKPRNNKGALTAGSIGAITGGLLGSVGRFTPGAERLNSNASTAAGAALGGLSMGYLGKKYDDISAQVNKPKYLKSDKPMEVEEYLQADVQSSPYDEYQKIKNNGS